jgi:hypothetical protein
MTPKQFALGFGTCLSLIVVASCGGQHVACGQGTKQVGNQCVPLSQTSDPLLGAWTKADDASGRMCEFFGNGEWSNTCFLLDGYAYKWERIYENRYYIGASYRACDAETAFSADEHTVTMSMLCGTTVTQTVQLLRFR